MFITLHKSRSAIRGTTVVETAFVLPIFLFFVLALIEYGHAQMVANVLQSACRDGARLGTTDGITSSDVESRVAQIIDSAIDSSQASLCVKDADVFDSEGPYPKTGAELASLPDFDLSTAEPRRLFMVHATVDYNDIALVPMPFMEGVVLSAEAFMRHE